MSRVLVATDKWRGSFTSRAAGEAMALGVRDALPGAVTAVIAVADGGEGTLDSLLAAGGFARRGTVVTGPRGRSVEASWARSDAGWAVLEMARAAGQPLVAADERDPLVTTTRGVGELVLAAMDEGSRRVAIALGGSATVDGGSGFLQALGLGLVDARGRELGRGGGALLELHAIDGSRADPRLSSTRFEAWCDVDNPLLGERGAARVFGPQKGADSIGVERLEAGLERLAWILERDLGVKVGTVPRSGSAGGLGAAMLAALGAELAPGAERVLDSIEFDRHLADADLVITGEGRYDGEAMPGKLVGVVAKRAAARGIRAVLVCGRDARSDVERGARPSDFSAVISGADLGRAPDTVLGLEDLAALGALAVRHP